MDQGITVGKMARELYPSGILVDEENLTSAVEKTKTLIADKNILVIYEASFSTDGYSAKVDILRRLEDGWHLIEVKSGLNVKPEYIYDITYTALVLYHSGIHVSKASLLLLSKNYRLGMGNEELFEEFECTEEVCKQLENFRSLWNLIQEKTGGAETPDRLLTLACRNCDMFRECLGAGIEYHIFDLPRFSQKRFDSLMELEITSVTDISDVFDLTENQKKIMECVKSGRMLLGKSLKKDLDSIAWPAYYLDFETVSTAIPLYPGVAPHAQILTQFSIHKCSSPEEIVNHFEYLADPSKDCRRDLAEKLIECLGDNGSILVYSRFERDRIKELIDEYPDFSARLSALLDRLVDLEAIIRNNVNHPDFHGKTSIKQVLPVLVPDMTYKGLTISEGGDASAYFAYLAIGEFKDKEDKIKKDLLEYCKHDTLGMVKLHERLLTYIG